MNTDGSQNEPFTWLNGFSAPHGGNTAGSGQGEDARVGPGMRPAAAHSAQAATAASRVQGEGSAGGGAPPVLPPPLFRPQARSALPSRAVPPRDRLPTPSQAPWPCPPLQIVAGNVTSYSAYALISAHLIVSRFKNRCRTAARRPERRAGLQNRPPTARGPGTDAGGWEFAGADGCGRAQAGERELKGRACRGAPGLGRS